MKKINIPNEIIFLISVITIAFGVALSATAGFGVSMIVAPAYILSIKIDFLTFGQAEYIIQSIIFIILCIILKKVKITFFQSFLTCLLYGLILDLIQGFIPFFNLSITPPESLDLWVRILLFISGMLLTAFSVALSFKAYFYPQVYDFFVNCVSKKYNIKTARFKSFFDISFLILSIILSLILFKGINGIGIGTVIMALFNGVLIGFFTKLFDCFFTFNPLSLKLSKYFEI